LESLSLITKINSWLNLEKENINLKNIVNEIIDWIKLRYLEKNIKLNLQITKEDMILNLFSVKIVLKNLIENAFKYSNINWEIIINITNSQIIIKDNWIWISKENQWKIWDKFWKEDVSRNDEDTFWLWLYIVKRICELNNWKINLNSEKNIWTTFTINI
jgi:K+-sensing histidine kinase KdpD